MKNFTPLFVASVCALALSACQTSTATKGHDHVKHSHTPTPSAPPVKTLDAVICKNQTISLDLNQGAVQQKGALKGYDYCEYQIALTAGQHLAVDFNAPSTTGAEVIVFDRLDLSDVALEKQGYTASKNETLPIRVLLTRNVARSGKAYPFEVKFSVR